MTHEITEIAFLSIDLDSIENVEDNPEAVTFDILLSRAPSADWLEEFDYLYHRIPSNMKPPIALRGDRLRVNFLPRYGDELQGFLNFLGSVVHQATEEERRTQAIQSSDRKEQLKRDFRQVLERAELPKTTK